MNINRIPAMAKATRKCSELAQSPCMDGLSVTIRKLTDATIPTVLLSRRFPSRKMSIDVPRLTKRSEKWMEDDSSPNIARMIA